MITVWVRESSSGRICAGVGAEIIHLVRLGHPLGSRVLVDGSTSPPAVRGRSVQGALSSAVGVPQDALAVLRFQAGR
jgi:hypothetical protein